MKKLLTYFWGIILVTQAFSQIQKIPFYNPFLENGSQSLFNLKDIINQSEQPLSESAKDYLFERFHFLQAHESSLMLSDVEKSEIGNHFMFQQTYKGIPIYGAFAKINLSSSNEVLSIFYNVTSTKNWETDSLKIQNISEYVSENYPVDGDITNASQVFYTDNNSTQPAIKVNILNFKAGQSKEIILDKDFNVLYERNTSRNLHNTDTTIKAYVFNPDPLTATRSNYGGFYIDNNDQDNAYLTAAREQVDITINDPVNNKFILEGKNVKIFDKSPPSNSVPETFTIFDYTRSQQEFEAVNVYYHINTFQKYIQDICCNDMANYQLEVDPHGRSDDQSQFLEKDKKEGYLVFGDGGIDDAEDADVIIHEYSHAISHNVSPNSYQGGNESEALEEGLCDYFACSYSKAISDYNWQKIYNWDGNETWDGRSCVTTKIYPKDLTGSVYDDAQIWTGTLMEINNEAGRELVDKLMLNILKEFAPGMKMRAAALLFLQADSLIHNKQYDWVITKHMVARGLLDKKYLSAIKEKPLDKLNVKSWYSNNSFHIELPEEYEEITVTLTSIDGKLIEKRNFHNIKDIHFTTSRNLQPAIYLIHIQSKTGMKTDKVFVQ